MKESSINRLKHLIKENLRNLYWGIYGNTIKNPGLPDNPKSFLFVCKGNVCRSPFAERLGIRIAENNGLAGMNFFSAGFEVSTSTHPPENAILAAESFGISLDSHKSKRISYEILNSFDMIFTTEIGHLKTLKESFPQFQDKIFLLPLFEKNKPYTKGSYHFCNIPDPYGKSFKQFYTCFQRIERCLNELFQDLRNGDHMKR